MAGQPIRRAITAAQMDALREVNAWRDEKATQIDARTDVSDDERAELHKILMREWGRKADALIKSAQRRGKRTQDQMRADLDAWKDAR